MARSFNGTVISDQRDKTITVRVDRQQSHPLYKKIFVTSKKYHVHDEDNQASVGDKVSFNDSQPISKTKRWVLDEIIEEGRA